MRSGATPALDQPPAHGLGPAPGHLEVVVDSPGVIGMALDGHRDSRIVA